MIKFYVLIMALVDTMSEVSGANLHLLKKDKNLFF